MAGPPDCVGTYSSSDEACNGSPAAKTPEEAMPCQWRERCKGLKNFCDESFTTPDEFVGRCSVEELLELCRLGGWRSDETHTAPVKHTTEDHGEDEQHVEVRDTPQESDNEQNVLDGHSSDKETTHAEHTPEEPALALQEPPKRKKKYKRRKRTLQPEVLELGEYFKELLADTFPTRRFAGRGEVVAKPGTLYAVDRVKACRYVKWYCSTRGGHDQAIACIKFKPRKKSIDLSLPVRLNELEEILGEDALRELDPKEVNNGQFLTVCRNIGKDGVASCMRVIRELADNGAIKISD